MPCQAQLLRNNFPVGQNFLFCRDDGIAHGFGVRRLAELVEQFGFLHDKAQAGQGVQMQPVVLAANQEEQMGRLAVGRAEMDFLDRPSHHDERGFKEVGFMGPRVRQRQSARHRRGTQFLARLQAGQQGF